MDTTQKTISDDDNDIELWKLKKLVKKLEDARGSGTSMISLILTPNEQLSRIGKMLTEEYGTASNIKNRVNRQSVLDAITKAQVYLKTMKNLPPNGLALYCGTIQTDMGDREVKIVFEPPKPVNTTLYLCDSKFHTEGLKYLFESNDKFGFIVMDGNGALFGTVTGSTRNILSQFTVDLPKKHGRGGQSALRFARLRLEKRHNYIRKVAETAVQVFIPHDKTNGTDKVNVTGLILAGSADFKTELGKSDLFDQRLQAKVIKIVDISYGGDAGFNQAIELCAESLQNVKFIQEKQQIAKFFDEINQDTGKYCFGLNDTFQALESGACEVLIVWEDLNIDRIELRVPNDDKLKVIYLTPEQECDDKYFKNENGIALEIINKEPLTDWIAVNYKRYGPLLHFVTNRTQEGAQFCRGFGGFGGILRYKTEFVANDDDDNNEINADEPY